jgi:hypothetical protein
VLHVCSPSRLLQVKASDSEEFWQSPLPLISPAHHPAEGHVAWWSDTDSLTLISANN